MRLPRILLSALLVLAATSAFAQQPAIPLWPHTAPEPAQTTAAEMDATKPTDNMISGHRTRRLTNVTSPTLTLYPPAHHNTGAAALVFPGGGYNLLAYDGEGTDVCEWLNTLGVSCLLVKYRVPEKGRYPDNPADLEDAQQAMRIARAHAKEWHIAPDRIGVIGFSAGGNLAALLSTHPDDHHVESTPAASDVDTALSAKPNFAMLIYPAYLTVLPAETTIDPVYQPNAFTPPTFLLQAEDDKYFSKNALVYYRALMDAKIPSELHIYPRGGHGFGVHPNGGPVANWTKLAEAWLNTIKVLQPAN